MLQWDEKSHHAWAAFGLSIAAGLLIWWASEIVDQGRTLAGASFRFPSSHVAGGQVLLATAGACFALVFSIGGARDSRHVAHLIIAGTPALAAIVMFWVWVSPISLPFSLVTFLVSNNVMILAPFLVGLLYVSALLRRRPL